MPTPPLSDELAIEAAAAYRSAGNKVTAAAARSMGIPYDTLKSRVKKAAERGLLLDTPAAMPGFGITQVTDTPNGGKFVQQKPEHGGAFELPKGHRVKGVSALLDPDGNKIIEWIKTTEDLTRTADLIASIHHEFDQYRGFAKLVPPPQETHSNLCNYYPVVDPHIGMLAYGKETGESNDLKIGVARVGGTLQRLIGLAPPAETAVILNTGDFFHADNQRNVTEASNHQLDVDGRNQKSKWAGVNMLRTAIDLALQRHKRVIVKNLKGNHDGDSAMWLNITLGLFYSNEPRVQIDPEDANNDHFFHLFGVNYIGATHGHTMKPDRMYIMMAEDNPEYWNASLYRWCIFGHIHHETKKMVGSLRCESFSQPVARDAYAHSHGYRSASAMQAITLHKQDGEIGRNIQNFPPTRGRTVETAA